MAYKDIKDKGFDTRTTDELQEITTKGGINSGIVRKEKATFKNAIKWLMESDIKIKGGNIYEYFKKSGIDISNLKPAQLAALGLWSGAIQGKAENYKTLMEANSELEDLQKETPTVNINIIDNSELEKALYEEDKL